MRMPFKISGFPLNCPRVVSYQHSFGWPPRLVLTVNSIVGSGCELQLAIHSERSIYRLRLMLTLRKAL